METINQLQSLTEQFNEQIKFLNINQINYFKSEKNLQDYCEAALLDLKIQLQTALDEENLPEIKFTIPDEKLNEILAANAKKKEYEERREKIVDIMSGLNVRRNQLFRENFDLLEDLDSIFWEVCIDPEASFNFEIDKLIIKKGKKNFEISYNRFTEPKEKVLAGIAVKIQEKKLNEQIHDREKEIAALKVKLTTLKSTGSITRKNHPKR